MRRTWDQADHEIRMEWGLAGARHLGRDALVVVVVDVLSFTTCVDVAVGRGATVHPYAWGAEGAAAFAERHGATLAVPRRYARPGEVSLSPASLRDADQLGAVVLPSPNGSTISAMLASSGASVVAACLRNRAAVAAWVADRVTTARARGEPVAVVAVPAGERWPDDTLRPAVEDLWGVGAVIAALLDAGIGTGSGTASPEAETAAAAYDVVADHLPDALAACGSGRELAGVGCAEDVAMAGELDVSAAVPVLRDRAYRAAS